MSIKHVYLLHQAQQTADLDLINTNIHPLKQQAYTPSMIIYKNWDMGWKEKKKLNAYISLHMLQKAFRVVITKLSETKKKVRMDWEHVILKFCTHPSFLAQRSWTRARIQENKVIRQKGKACSVRRAWDASSSEHIPTWQATIDVQLLSTPSRKQSNTNNQLKHGY